MKRFKLYLGILTTLIVIYLVAEFNRPAAVDWTPTLSSNDKIPFGTYIIYNRINDIFPKAKIQTFREPIYNVLTDHEIAHGTYLIICNSIDLNEYDYQKLMAFVKNGNDVFISALLFGKEFSKRLKVESEPESRKWNNTSGLKFTNKYLDTNKVYHAGENIGATFFDKFDTVSATVLGVNTFNHADFLRYSKGKGTLYLSSNPLMFSNYSLLNKDGNEYAAIALSHLKNDSIFIWDQYYALGREDDGASMRVFLRNSALRWSFYIAFFALITFVLFEIKRRQRIIPIIEPLRNSTLDFVNVVGQVYYEKRNNANIAQKKIAYLLEHLREEYQLKTNKLDGEFAGKFAAKLGVRLSFAEDMVNYILYINALGRVTDAELIELNNLIEQLYIKSK